MAVLAYGASAQVLRVRPATPRVKPQLILGGTLTVTPSPSTVNFTLVHGGVAAGSSGVTVTTTWDLIGFGSTLNLYGYFSSSTAALSDGLSPAHLIPSSAVLGQMSTGVPTTYTAFTQTVPFGAAGAGLELLNAAYGFTVIGSRTDVLNLEINLSGVPTLPAGTYSGTLTLQATMN